MIETRKPRPIELIVYILLLIIIIFFFIKACQKEKPLSQAQKVWVMEKTARIVPIMD